VIQPKQNCLDGPVIEYMMIDEAINSAYGGAVV
jgi:hypothetical protein